MADHFRFDDVGVAEIRDLVVGRISHTRKEEASVIRDGIVKLCGLTMDLCMRARLRE